MTIEETAKRVYRATLRRTPLSAGEIAEKAGLPSSRGATSLAIGELVRDKKISRITGRPARYLRA